MKMAEARETWKCLKRGGEMGGQRGGTGASVVGKYKGANRRNIALTSCRVGGHILLQAASKRNSQKQS